MADKIDRIFDTIDAAVRGLGCEVVDVEKRIEYGEVHITIYADKLPEGISLDDCELLHYAIDPLIDELDPTDGRPYVLEVSSPGLDRPLKRQRDFERNYGKEVEVRLYAPVKGHKSYEGVLRQRTDGYVLVECDGEDVKIENTRIAAVKPLVKFD